MPRSCPTCGSKRWRKDAVTGSAVCEEGHVFQDFRSENLDIDPLVGYALQKRRMRTGERINKRKVYGRANKEFYHGDEAEYLKLQAFQLLLRYQVQALKKLWALPDIYEAIVRDLWSYQLAMSPLPPVPDSSASEIQLDNAVSEGLVEMDDNEKTDLAEEKEEGSDVSLEERYNPKEEEFDDEEELLRRLSEDEDGSDKEDDSPEAADGREKNWRRRRRLVISDTIVTLVLGLWVLRYPLMNVELERAINDNEIPYLDFCSSSLLPPEMRMHMGKELVLALSPRMAPTPLQLFAQCRLSAKVLSRQFGVVIPELNAPAVVWKTISTLGGSPTTYDQILRLLSLLSVRLSLLNKSLRRVAVKVRGRSSTHIDTLRRSQSDSNLDSPALSSDDSNEDMPTRVRTTERPQKYYEVLLPELAVAAAWVVIMKMAYGLDGNVRHAIGKGEPALSMPEGSAYLDELRAQTGGGGLKGTAGGLDKGDFTRMTEDDMDAFLSQAEKVLLRDRPDTGLDVSLFPFMPSSRHPGTSKPDWTRFHSTTAVVMPLDIPLDTSSRQMPLQPGEELRTYEISDETGTLPPDLELVLGAASDVIGVKAEEILRIAGVFERRLRRVKRERSRSRSKSREQSRSNSRAQDRRRSESSLRSG